MERKLTVVVVALRGGENVKMKTGKKKKTRDFYGYGSVLSVCVWRFSRPKSGQSGDLEKERCILYVC